MGERAGEFQLVVRAGHQIRVVAVLHRRVEAEQRRQPGPIQWEPGRAEGGGPQRAAVDAPIAFAQTLGVAPQRGGEREEVVAEGGRLRLHAVGVRRHGRVRMRLGERHDLPARAQQFAQHGKPFGARQHAPRRAVQILPRAPHVDVRRLHAGQFHKTLLEIQIVGSARGARTRLLLHHPRGGVGDARRQWRVEEALLRQHHQRRRVGAGHVAEEVRARRGRRRVRRREHFHQRVREGGGGGGDCGAILLVRHLERDGGNAEAAVEVVLRRAVLGEAAGGVLERVDAGFLARRGQPTRRELRWAGWRRGILGEEDVAPGGVEVQHHPGAAAPSFQTGDQTAHRLGFGLGELAPVAVEVRVPQIVPPMPGVHAVRVQVGHHDDAVRAEKPAARLRFRAGARPRLEQPFDESRQRQRAGDFRGVLAAEQQQVVRRVLVDRERVDRLATQRPPDFPPTKVVRHSGNLLAPLGVEGVVQILAGGHEQPVRRGAQPQHRVAVDQPHVPVRQGLPRFAIGAHLGPIAVLVFPVVQAHRERAPLRGIHRPHMEAVPRAGVDLAAVLRANTHAHFVGGHHFAGAEAGARIVRSQGECAGGAGVGCILRGARPRQNARQQREREERATAMLRHRRPRRKFSAWSHKPGQRVHSTASTSPHAHAVDAVTRAPVSAM